MSYPLTGHGWSWRPSWDIMQSGGWYCPRCGEAVRPDGRRNDGHFCLNCRPFAEATCPKCGARLVGRRGHHDPGCSVRPPTPRWEVGFPLWQS